MSEGGGRSALLTYGGRSVATGVDGDAPGALPAVGRTPYAGAMRIANPMYDAASARLLVDAVLGEEIESLEPLPQERSVRASPPPVPGEPTPAELFTVRRVDFAATVRTASGERLRVLVAPEPAL